ncbi:MAG TPA: hypothetical protein DDW61_03810, partial [Actinobacteria bacterium]|nr:hypothetical protein [Actinomycetota bacterium]
LAGGKRMSMDQVEGPRPDAAAVHLGRKQVSVNDLEALAPHRLSKSSGIACQNWRTFGLADGAQLCAHIGLQPTERGLETGGDQYAHLARSLP